MRGAHSLSKLLKNIFIAWLSCSFVFSIATLFSYVHLKETAKANLATVVNRIVSDIDKEFTVVDDTLKYAVDLSLNCEPHSLHHMRRLVFENPGMSEIGVIDPKGKLICNSFGRLTPPVNTSAPLKQSGLRYYGPIITDYLELPAFVLARTRDDGYEVNVLMPDHWLKRMLDISAHHDTDFAALVDNTTGVPIFLNGNYSLPIRQKLFPAKNRQAVEGHFDDGAVKFAYISAIPSLPQLSLIIAKNDDRLVKMEWIWGLLWGVLYCCSWGGLTFLLINYDKRQLSSKTQILRALANEELFNVYQPLVCAQSKSIVGVEVLIRWRHPLEGDLGPAYFVPEAERDGTILDISIAQVEEAMRDLSEILLQQPKFKVSFNVNGLLLGSKRYIDTLLCAKKHISSLTIELTERDVLTQAQTKTVLNELKRAGIEIAIDDFGTGYSGLQYLQSFPIDLLKIDQSFVASIGLDTLQSPVLAAVIDMAEKLDKKLIAEGVETQAQADYLQSRGVNIHQGWLYYQALELPQLKHEMNK
ncbi:EAL domain-containing protein [Pseudoalteromonas sp. PS5]|uniref:EAL domain-containing protein n=1 Tax=Pseudoalteromonas sp. PS5 TaxID=1437473 RepID=UPI000FFF1FBE|nr:EAL domain-containing protein [Pseudoalteromonas sp. PS5]RXF03038.1 EAL domain-containing protein [Pseudoalteromonas sp. PS5]